MALIFFLVATARANIPTDPSTILKFAGHYRAIGPSLTECEENWQDVYLKADAAQGVLSLGPAVDDSAQDFQISPESMFGLQTDYSGQTEIYYLSTPTGCVFRKLR